MAPTLPQDILFLICEALLEQREFHTLFCCSLTSKSLLVPAISNLYRMQDVAPVTTGGGEDAPNKSGPGSSGGWARLWGTLVRSSLGTTKYPYCRYIRVLNLHDIQDLLENQTFRSLHSKAFFSGDMAFLHLERDATTAAAGPKKKGRPAAKPLDVLAIVRRVADLMTATAPLIQELAGNLEPEALAEWIPRVRRLQNLRLWDGMSAEGLGPLLREHCAQFTSISFFSTRGPECDAVLAEFLAALRPDSLQAYEAFSAEATSSADFFAAFAHHAASLQSLKLQSLPGDGLANMGEMSACTALRTLHVQIDRAPPPPAGAAPGAAAAAAAAEAAGEPPLPGVVAWLRGCTQLTDLSLDSKGDSGEFFLKLLAPVLLDPDVRLAALAVTMYSSPAANSPAAASFYRALTNQAPSLHSLTLRTDGDFVDNDALVATLAHLAHLTYLRLHSVSDYFADRHITAVARALPALEELWISGWSITDAVWDALGALESLRRLEMAAFSAFSFEGILAFINDLDPLNQRGFVLSIMMADPASELARNEDAQTLLRTEIANRVDGRFDYTLARDPNAEDYSSSDSD